jgi:uncharacterized protein YneF (UPF0154 family)
MDFLIYLLTLNVGVLVGFFLASLLAANEHHRERMNNEQLR